MLPKLLTFAAALALVLTTADACPKRTCNKCQQSSAAAAPALIQRSASASAFAKAGGGSYFVPAPAPAVPTIPPEALSAAAEAYAAQAKAAADAASQRTELLGMMSRLLAETDSAATFRPLATFAQPFTFTANAAPIGGEVATAAASSSSTAGGSARSGRLGLLARMSENRQNRVDDREFRRAQRRGDTMAQSRTTANGVTTRATAGGGR